MEKKKINLGKPILIILAVILVIFVMLTLRKVIIINHLDKKLAKQIENTNVYVKTEEEDVIIEAYRKENTTKYIMYNKKSNIKLTQITSDTKRLLYIDDGEEKRMYEYPGDGENEFFVQNQNIIPNYVASTTFWKKLLNSIGSRITSKQIGDKQCYVINSLSNPNILYDENATSLAIYLEKQTGLPVKMVETIKENSGKKEKVTTYQYQFNQVTQQDIAPLEESQYSKQENNE